MTGNSFGTLLRYTSWGESHGTQIGCVVDGVPPRIPLTEGDLQPWLDKRRPGQSRHTTQRQEKDQVEIVSGVFEGQTTGAPIGLIIHNTDVRSKDYSDIKDKYRPGHADFTYDKKYGLRDYRGGGRSSARETAMRVAAGGIARKILSRAFEGDIFIGAAVTQIGPHPIQRTHWDWNEINNNPFFSPDKDIVETWSAFLDQTRKNASSAGALVEAVVKGIPAGLGAPVYDKLDADLAKAMMSIPAVKGIDIGLGFDCVHTSGEDNVDEIRQGANGDAEFLSNNAGGILGGISTGQDITLRVAFKPTSSLPQPRKTITRAGENTEIVTKGRHDPCVGIRGAPVVEAMLALTLADHWLRHKAQCLSPN